MSAPIFKASPLGRAVTTWDQRQARLAAKRRLRAQADKFRAALVALVWARDQGRCRVCGMAVVRPSRGTDPRRHGHVHEIVYRSAGGRQEPNNAVLLCASDHAAEHEHRLVITGTSAQLEIRRASDGPDGFPYA